MHFACGQRESFTKSVACIVKAAYYSNHFLVVTIHHFYTYLRNKSLPDIVFNLVRGDEGK